MSGASSSTVVCDTGFLVALVDSEDSLHAEASYYFESTKCRFLVTISVMVEAFHLLKKRGLLNRLYGHVFDPGAFDLMDDQCKFTAECVELQKLRSELDLVDCLLLIYAVKIAEGQRQQRPMQIVTGDTRMIGIAYGVRDDHDFVCLQDLR